MSEEERVKSLYESGDLFKILDSIYSPETVAEDSSDVAGDLISFELEICNSAISGAELTDFQKVYARAIFDYAAREPRFFNYCVLFSPAAYKSVYKFDTQALDTIDLITGEMRETYLQYYQEYKDIDGIIPDDGFFYPFLTGYYDEYPEMVNDCFSRLLKYDLRGDEIPYTAIFFALDYNLYLSAKEFGYDEEDLFIIPCRFDGDDKVSGGFINYDICGQPVNIYISKESIYEVNGSKVTPLQMALIYGSHEAMHVNRGFRVLDPELNYEKGDLFHIFDGILTAESETPDKEYSNIYYLSDNHESFYSEYEANKYAIDHFRKLYADRGIEIDVEKVYKYTLKSGVERYEHKKGFYVTKDDHLEPVTFISSSIIEYLNEILGRNAIYHKMFPVLDRFFKNGYVEVSDAVKSYLEEYQDNCDEETIYDIFFESLAESDQGFTFLFPRFEAQKENVLLKIITLTTNNLLRVKDQFEFGIVPPSDEYLMDAFGYSSVIAASFVLDYLSKNEDDIVSLGNEKLIHKIHIFNDALIRLVNHKDFCFDLTRKELSNIRPLSEDYGKKSSDRTKKLGEYNG